MGRVVRTLHDDDSSSESESESEDEVVTAKRPRLSPDAVSELSESKTREYEESPMEKDEEIDALKREPGAEDDPWNRQEDEGNQGQPSLHDERGSGKRH